MAYLGALLMAAVTPVVTVKHDEAGGSPQVQRAPSQSARRLEAGSLVTISGTPARRMVGRGGLEEGEEESSMWWLVWLMGAILVGTGAVFAVTAVAFEYLGKQRKGGDSEDDIFASPRASIENDKRTFVKSPEFMAFKGTMDGRAEEELSHFSLAFLDEAMEASYLKFQVVTLCDACAPLALGGLLFSLWRLMGHGLTLSHWETPPAVVYNMSWLWFLVLSATLLGLCCRSVRFRGYKQAELVVLAYAVIASLVVTLLGSKWAVSHLLGYSDPESVSRSFPSWQPHEGKVAVQLMAGLLYMAMYTPLRFSRLIAVGAWVSLAYPAVKLYVGSPEDKDEIYPVEHLVMFVFIVALILFGQRGVERQRRLAYLALVETFETLEGKTQKAQLF